MARVLIVEDDDDLAEAEREIFAMAGAASVVAHSLAEAQRLGDDALACEIAILDVNLGAGRPTGVEVSEWLRRSGFGGKVVFLTGHARTHPLVQRAAAIPGTTILGKPVDTAVLLQLVA